MGAPPDAGGLTGGWALQQQLQSKTSRIDPNSAAFFLPRGLRRVAGNVSCCVCRAELVIKTASIWVEGHASRVRGTRYSILFPPAWLRAKLRRAAALWSGSFGSGRDPGQTAPSTQHGYTICHLGERNRKLFQHKVHAFYKVNTVNIPFAPRMGLVITPTRARGVLTVHQTPLPTTRRSKLTACLSSLGSSSRSSSPRAAAAASRDGGRRPRRRRRHPWRRHPPRRRDDVNVA